jgi:hypothetical protein
MRQGKATARISCWDLHQDVERRIPDSTPARKLPGTADRINRLDHPYSGSARCGCSDRPWFLVSSTRYPAVGPAERSVGQMVIPDDPQRPVAVLRSASPRRPGSLCRPGRRQGARRALQAALQALGSPLQTSEPARGIDCVVYAQGRGSFASWRDSSRRPGPFFARSQLQHHTFFTQRKATPWYSLIHDETTGRNAEDGA